MDGSIHRPPHSPALRLIRSVKMPSSSDAFASDNIA